MLREDFSKCRVSASEGGQPGKAFLQCNVLVQKTQNSVTPTSQEKKM